ncbi:MAG TPA: hypothetical protein VGI87_02950 [Solirubrobacteraceae bacterium]
MVAVLVGTGLATYAVAAPNKKPAKHKPKVRKFSEVLNGAQLSSSGNKAVDVYEVKSSVDGHGAGVQKTTVAGSAFPLTGTDKVTVYYANGVDNAADKFTLATPDANGNSAITGSGKCLGGTGVHRHEKCSYTFTGSYNINTLLVNVTAHGTDKR